MKKNHNKIYDEYVQVPTDIKEYIIDSCKNQRKLCIVALDMLNDNKELSFKDLKQDIKDYILDNNIKPVIIECLNNELYYKYKDYQKGKIVKISNDDIYYLTSIFYSYSGRNFKYEQGSLELTLFNHLKGIIIPKALPVLKDGSINFINLGYSSIEDRFVLSMYTKEN